jgi:hypothetical protein
LLKNSFVVVNTDLVGVLVAGGKVNHEGYSVDLSLGKARVVLGETSVDKGSERVSGLHVLHVGHLVAVERVSRVNSADSLEQVALKIVLGHSLEKTFDSFLLTAETDLLEDTRFLHSLEVSLLNRNELLDLLLANTHNFSQLSALELGDVKSFLKDASFS